MQPLEAPAVLYELHREPVEQLGMRRRVALQAKVLTRAHQARAEIGLPNSIDNRPGRGLAAVVNKPASKVETRGILFRHFMQKRRHARLNRLRWLQEVASRQHE